MQSQAIYVLDTNIIIDYPDIIPNGKIFIPDAPIVDLSSAHIIIPTIVIRELSNFKTEMNTDRGHIAREILERLRKIFANCATSIDEYVNCKKPIFVHGEKQSFSILPVNHELAKTLPFCITNDDADGQIILTTLSAIFASQNPNENLRNLDLSKSCVTLLTNDNGLAIRASSLGIKTSRYGYKQPAPYTGRRHLTVPADLFEIFWNSGSISLADWEESMPDEPKLIANEFIIMEADSWPKDYEQNCLNYISNVGYYSAEDQAIIKLKYAYNFPVHVKTYGQAIFAESLMSPDISVVICTGPAGTGKTFLSAVYALEAVKNGDYIGISVVPCGHEKNNIGALPGDMTDKLDPYVQPIKNAIRNHLLKTEFAKELKNLRKFGATNKSGKSEQVQKSLKESLNNRVDNNYQNWFGEPIPIEFARGRDFSHEIAIYDEFQDQNFRQADTLIKRLGEDGKIIITGDIEQIHSNYLDRENNGIVYASKILKDSPMVARVSLLEEEVVRHPLVKLIAERQKSSPCV